MQNDSDVEVTEEATVQNEQSDNQPSSKKRPRLLLSPAWQHYEYIAPSEKFPYDRAKCKDCGTYYKADPKSGTGNMNRHIEVCARRSTRDMGQMLISSSKSLSTCSSNFDPMIWRKYMAKLVTKHNLPLNFVEFSSFREACKYLNPNVQFTSRNTLRSDCIRIFKEEASKMRNSFLSAFGSGRISLTSDCWSSSTGDGYICLTGHYIDAKWRIQKRILSFKYFGPPHSGKFIAEKIEEMVNVWGIDKRIFSITLDNASANNSAVALLKSKLRLRNGLLCDGAYLHVRCAAHIMNLVVQDGLKYIEKSIERVRESVRYVKGSQARKLRFIQCGVRSGLDMKKGVIIDVPTRWNSTYLMLERAAYFEHAFEELSLIDDDFDTCPSKEEWRNMKVIRDFLKVFYNFTLKVSAVKRPTSNIFFPWVFRVYVAITESMSGSDADLRLMATRMLEKFNKYWKDFSDIMAIACVLDPRYKLYYIDYVYTTIYPDDSRARFKEFKEKLFTLYNEYSHLTPRIESVDDTYDSSKEDHDILVEEDAQWAQRFESFVPSAFSCEKSQLERYLEEEKLEATKNLDILSFWERNSLRYPAVAVMAKDVHAIPISTVASESAFSVSGNILDSYRSLLGDDIIEPLVCGKDWILANEANEEDNLITLLEGMALKQT